MSIAANSGAVASIYSNSREKERVQATNASVPWYVWMGVLAVTSSSIGGTWDIAWHRSIGRDTFWTPAHIAVYACGVLAGIVGLWLTLQSTFGQDQKRRDSAVSLFGLRAPFGVFLAGWGGVAMLTSAPFDNWWHNAYGLDVKIISPPHTLLILGTRAVEIGIMFLILAEMNRSVKAGNKAFKSLQVLYLYMGGLLVSGQMLFLREFTGDTRLHQFLPYMATGIAVPMILTAMSQSSRSRWAATWTSAVYMIFLIGEILVMPLFPAVPKLGPVYFPVTHLVPAKFPILLIIPALALDLLWQRTRNWKLWQVALASGFVFIAVLVAVEWPFANFLMSPASANRFFGTMYFGYYSKATSLDRLRQFDPADQGVTLWFGLLRASIYASISMWAGLAFGRWMREVQR